MSVSVVVTCHDEEATIEQAVRSVEAQTIFDSVEEIIVVEDGSRDGSRTVLGRLDDEIEKLRITKTPGLGPSAARNRAVHLATGEFVAFLDGDDFWTPEKLERHISAFGQSPKIGLVYGDFIDFCRDDATDGRLVTVRRFDPESAHQLRDYFVHDGPIMPSTLVIRRSVFTDVGLFDESLRIGEDTELCLRIAEKWRFCHVSGAFTFKRRHSGQASSRLDAYLPNAVRVTQEFASRHSELERLASRRMARVHAKISADCAIKGERRQALRHDLTALRLAPLHARAWANLALLPLPSSVIRPVYRGLKRPWHAVRHTWNSA